MFSLVLDYIVRHPFMRVTQKVHKLIQMGIINFSDIVSLLNTISHYNIALLITGLLLFVPLCPILSFAMVSRWH